MTQTDFTGRAQARVGLLGNPSDGFGGRVIAMTLPQFDAIVTITPASQWQWGSTNLLHATSSALRRHRPELVAEPGSVSFTTTIPRQVGLAGSSAIIIAALRALAARSSVEWDLVELAKMALHIETDLLGWAAGPQDRVVQAYEGPVDMDFGEPWQADRYRRLDAASLPPLFVAWNQSMGTPSTVAHTWVRERWDAGDRRVVDTMREFAELAAAGRAALDNNTAATEWPPLIAQAFELRRAIWNITEIDEALVETGKQLGAGVAFAGSGGAVVGCPADPTALPAIEAAYRELGAGFLVIA